MKMKHIWKLTKAGKTSCYKEYDLQCIASTSEYYSSLRKVRTVVHDAFVSGEIPSIDKWSEEKWQSKNYCIVINSGGSAVFSFQKIYVK